MQRFKLRGGRIAGVLGALTMLGGALALGAGAVSADTGVFPLTPIPGSSSTGGGSVTVFPTSAGMQVQIDLSGARAGNAYNVSICTDTGVSFACVSGGTI